MNGPVMLGGSGRVARLVTACWRGAPPLIVARRAGVGVDLVWQMDGPPPALPVRYRHRPVIVNLAGVTPRAGGDLGGNTALALAGLDAARDWGACHLFVMSSSAVYGDTGRAPATESRPLAPFGPYGIAKAEMETALLRAAGMHPDIGVTVLRLANVAGAGQPFDAADETGATPLTLDRFADGQGPSRSYIGPATLAECLRCLCRHAADGTDLPNVLNLAAPRPTPMEAILDALGQPFVWRDAPERAIQSVHLDVQKLAELCPDAASDGADARTLVTQARSARRGCNT